MQRDTEAARAMHQEVRSWLDSATGRVGILSRGPASCAVCGREITVEETAIHLHGLTLHIMCAAHLRRRLVG